MPGQFVVVVNNQEITLTSQNIWQHYLDIYDRITYSEYNALYLQVASDLAESGAHTIIDLGCATGKLKKYLDQKFYLGIDHNSDSIGKAQEKYKNQPNIKFVRADTLHPIIPPNYPKQYDAVVSLNHLYAVNHPEKQIEVMVGLAHKGSTLVIANMNSSYNFAALKAGFSEQNLALIEGGFLSKEDIDTLTACEAFIQSTMVDPQFYQTDGHDLEQMLAKVGVSKILKTTKDISNQASFHGQVSYVAANTS